MVQRTLTHAARRFVREIRAVAQCSDRATAALFLVHVAAHLRSVLREGTLRGADRAVAGRTLEARVFGQRLRIAGEHFGGVREMYGRKVYFALPQFRLRPGDAAIDLGANVGLFTLLAARLGAKTVAVEAQSAFLPRIRQNLEANHCTSNAHLEWGMIGSRSGVFCDPAARRSASHFVGDPPTLSLNDLVERYGLARIDFLKIDIEGSEFDLLSRDTDWLNITAKVAMEVHPAFGDPSVLASRFRKAGFETWMLDAELCPTDRITSPGYLYALRTSPTRME